jgi:ElaB/YqjD/DUF883 family membrane-anchored ribosome-binding protein
VGQERSEVGPGVTAERTPEEIRQEIEATREDLGETVEALSAKTDVKDQAREKAADVKRQAREKVAELRHTVTAKKQAVTGQASAGAPGSADPVTAKAKGFARDNPTAVAAAAALAAGFLLGRLSSR